MGAEVGVRDEPDFDPASVFPEIGWLRQAAAARDWPAVSGFLLRQRDDHDRSALTRFVAEADGIEALLEAEARRGTSSLPHVLLAHRYNVLAWQARTDKQAKLVSRSQFEVMHDYLRRAERILIDVIAREPDNVLAWEARLVTALGLQLGQSEARRRYDRLAAHNPHHFRAQSNRLQQLCPKWSGSWEGMLAFARDSFRAAPPGSLQGALVAEAHYERRFEFDTGAERKEYLRRPEVMRELVEAAEASVLHPAFRRRYGWVGAHGYFAVIFSLAGEHARAAVHFQAMNGFASEYPWSQFADKAATYRKYRDLALAAAGGRS